MPHSYPVDPVLAQATRRMIRCLDEVERANVAEALELAR